MNVIMYVPFKGGKLFWHLANPDLGWVRFTIAEKYEGAENALFDGIYEMHCHAESTHPVVREGESE